MDEYADIYYVDTRNADARDHRTGTPGQAPSPWNRMQPTRTIVVPPNQRPVWYGSQPPAQVIYATPQQPSFAGSLFGKLTVGQVIEMVTQLFAALQSLPAAPIGTKDTSVDLNNLMLYQGALAQHAKRDEQVRTLGSLVAKVVG